MKRVIERALEVIMILGILYLVSGCGTINGLATDIEHLAGGVRQATQKSLNQEDATRVNGATRNLNQ